LLSRPGPGQFFSLKESMQPIAAAADTLHSLGWSSGDCSIMPGRFAWMVTCTRGGLSIVVLAPTQTGAWEESARQAEALAVAGG
jgi:hypothetical protein